MHYRCIEYEKQSRQVSSGSFTSIVRRTQLTCLVNIGDTNKSGQSYNHYCFGKAKSPTSRIRSTRRTSRLTKKAYLGQQLIDTLFLFYLIQVFLTLYDVIFLRGSLQRRLRTRCDFGSFGRFNLGQFITQTTFGWGHSIIQHVVGQLKTFFHRHLICFGYITIGNV